MGKTDVAAEQPTAPGQLAQPTSKGPADLVPGLALVLAATVVASQLSGLIGPLSTLVCAVLLGALIGNLGFATPRTAPGLTFAAKRLLRVGVVLLGLRLSGQDVLALGGSTLIVVVGTVTATFFGTQWIGRRFGLSPDFALLIATGFSICGASAIAAVESATDAEEEEVAAAIGLVTLFGSIAIVVLPLLGTVLGMTDDQFGTWAGASVHDVAQVVATASSGGAEVVAVAIVVKLTRVALLAPLVAGVSLRHRGRDRSGGKRPPVLPLFVAGFLLAIVVRTSGIMSDSLIANAKTLEGWLLAAALVGLGSGVRFDRLRTLGHRPLVVGALAWALVAVTSVVGVFLVV